MPIAIIAATAALGGLLFGYDTGAISGALLFLREAFHLSPLMLGVVTSIALAGSVVARFCWAGSRGWASASACSRQPSCWATAPCWARTSMERDAGGRMYVERCSPDGDRHKLPPVRCVGARQAVPPSTMSNAVSIV